MKFMKGDMVCFNQKFIKGFFLRRHGHLVRVNRKTVVIEDVSIFCEKRQYTINKKDVTPIEEFNYIT